MDAKGAQHTLQSSRSKVIVHGNDIMGTEIQRKATHTMMQSHLYTCIHLLQQHFYNRVDLKKVF